MFQVPYGIRDNGLSWCAVPDAYDIPGMSIPLCVVLDTYDTLDRSPFLFVAHNGNDRHGRFRSEEHTSELQSLVNLVCRLLLEKKKKIIIKITFSMIE